MEEQNKSTKKDKSFKGQGNFFDKLDPLIPEEIEFQDLMDKISWVHETNKF